MLYNLLVFDSYFSCSALWNFKSIPMPWQHILNVVFCSWMWQWRICCWSTGDWGLKLISIVTLLFVVIDDALFFFWLLSIVTNLLISEVKCCIVQHFVHWRFPISKKLRQDIDTSKERDSVFDKKNSSSDFVLWEKNTYPIWFQNSLVHEQGL